NLITYNEKERTEKHLESPQNIDDLIENNKTNWLKVKGLSDISAIKEIGQNFNLHPLVLEDIVNTKQRPKLEEYDDYLFIVMKSICFHENEYQTAHISIILGKNYVITFYESELAIFNTLNSRLETALGQIRKEGSDYLTYTIIDTIVDQYYIVTETIGDYTENLEDNLILKKIPKGAIQEIQELKHKFIELRRIIYPSKEVVIKLSRIKHPYFTSKKKEYITYII